MMRIVLITSAVLLSAFVVTQIYPKIADDLQWLAEDDVKQGLEPVLPSALGVKLSKPGLATHSLDGLKQATQNPKANNSPPPARPNKQASREMIETVVDVEGSEQLPKLLRPEVVSHVNDPVTVKKKDERWVSHLSGSQISVQSKANGEDRQRCHVDDDDCSRNFAPNFSLVGVVVSTDKVKQGKVVDGRLVIGDVKDTPALYLQ